MLTSAIDGKLRAAFFLSAAGLNVIPFCVWTVSAALRPGLLFVVLWKSKAINGLTSCAHPWLTSLKKIGVSAVVLNSTTRLRVQHRRQGEVL